MKSLPVSMEGPARSAFLNPHPRGEWDVLVVGAGPAGSLAARQLARLGLSVLMVDKEPFPRWKVCGCCLSARALSVLDSVGLGDLPRALGGVPLRRIRLAARNREACLPMTVGESEGEGLALSREALDLALIEAAMAAGAVFCPATRASLDGHQGGIRQVQLHQGGKTRLVLARSVLAADGLAGRLVAGEPGFRTEVLPLARIGVGAVVSSVSGFYETGTIHMAIGPGGYVGLVRLEDGRLNVAAALDRSFLRRTGGPGEAALHLIEEAGWPALPGLAEVAWRGTPPLTRQARRVAGERLFLLGDGAGYVEPFTGEGMAWALTSAAAVTPIVVQAVHCWQPALIQQWSARHRRLVRDRQRLCRSVAWVLRHPPLVRMCLTALSYWPSLATPVLRHLNAPSPFGREAVA